MMNKARQPLGCRQCVVYTAWRTVNAVKTNKGARDLSRAARPEDQ